MKISLLLSDDQLKELKEALRDKAYIYTKAQGALAPALWERANVIDDILIQIYKEEGES